jgi:hypothetical protein
MEQVTLIMSRIKELFPSAKLDAEGPSKGGRFWIELDHQHTALDIEVRPDGIVGIADAHEQHEHYGEGAHELFENADQALERIFTMLRQEQQAPA